MAISVQPNTDEIHQLVADSMELVQAINDQLHIVQNPNQPPPDDYWELRAKQSVLEAQIMAWLKTGIQLDLEGAGQAVDVINTSASSLKQALATTQTIARDIRMVSAFVDLAVAISGGKPQNIAQTGVAFAKTLKG